MSPFSNACVLTGPTGSGKSALALAIAARMSVEIVSMDSMTLYRGMDIGTAKPDAVDRASVPHHLIDILDPWESANVAFWLAQAEAACREILARGKTPLFVGGTPFYLMALTYGLFEGPPADETVRQMLERRIASEGAEAIHAELAAVDPGSAARIHPNDQRRIVRALEVWQLTGQPLSAFQQTWDTPAFPNRESSLAVPLRLVELVWPRETLYARIDRRVDQMLASGWREECQQLLELPKPLSREAMAAIGYRELFEHLSNPVRPFEDTAALIRQRTRQFAKRQLTWFRRMANRVSIPADASDCMDRAIRAFSGSDSSFPA